MYPSSYGKSTITVVMYSLAIHTQLRKENVMEIKRRYTNLSFKYLSNAATNL